MKKSVILLLMANLILIIQYAYSQCPKDHLVLKCQSQIDNFPVNYPNCKVITKGIYIQDDNIDPIQNLDSLYNLIEVQTHLIVSNNRVLKNLDGLRNIQKVDHLVVTTNKLITNLNGLSKISEISKGALRIQMNENLENLDGLKNIQKVNSDINISRNPKLKDLKGLENITVINEKLDIGFNDSLTSLHGLEQVNALNGGLYIGNNNSLTNLNGLQNIISVKKYVIISANENLIDFHGFQNIKSIGGYLLIAGNKSLTNLDALKNLTSINGALWIWNNFKLNSLSGLSNLDANGIKSHTDYYKDIEIFNNLNLSECNIPPICDAIGDDMISTLIQNNAINCMNREEIKEICNIYNTNSTLVNPEQVLLFPNPLTTNQINIILNNVFPEILINVYNLDGINILNTLRKNCSSVLIDLDLTAGIYLIDLKTFNNASVRKKLIVIK